jgi:hypothetical protein
VKKILDHLASRCCCVTKTIIIVMPDLREQIRGYVIGSQNQDDVQWRALFWHLQFHQKCSTSWEIKGVSGLREICFLNRHISVIIIICSSNSIVFLAQRNSKIACCFGMVNPVRKFPSLLDIEISELARNINICKAFYKVALYQHHQQTHRLVKIDHLPVISSSKCVSLRLRWLVTCCNTP